MNRGADIKVAANVQGARTRCGSKCDDRRKAPMRAGVILGLLPSVAVLSCCENMKRYLYTIRMQIAFLLLKRIIKGGVL